MEQGLLRLLRTKEKPDANAIKGLIAFVDKHIDEVKQQGICPSEALAPLGKFLYRLKLTDFAAWCFLAACEYGKKNGCTKKQHEWFAAAQENLCMSAEKYVVSAYGFEILHDKELIRNIGIELAKVVPGKTFLDINGSSTCAAFSVMASQNGASHVTAFEFSVLRSYLTRRILETNGCNASSIYIDADEPMETCSNAVDVVSFDVWGGLGADILAGVIPNTIATLMAAGHINQSTVIFPTAIILNVCIVESDDLAKLEQISDKVVGFDLSAFNVLAKAVRPLNLKNFRYNYVTEVMSIRYDDLRILAQRSQQTVQLKILGEQLDGGKNWFLAYWYDIDIGSEIKISRSPQHNQPSSIQFIRRLPQTFKQMSNEISLSVTVDEDDGLIFKFNGSDDGDGGIKGNARGSSAILGYHFSMINDHHRAEMYDAAIRKVVNESKTVLDIGCGSGLLAMMAARAGAKTVTACELEPKIAEVATQVIAQNDLSSQIQVIPTISTKLEVGKHMPVQADVMICEIFGDDPWSERFLPTYRHAKEKLMTSDNSVVVPAAVTVKAILVQSDALRKSRSLPVKEESSYDASIWELLAVQRKSIRINEVEHTVLSEVFVAMEINFNEQGIVETKGKPTTIQAKIIADGQVDCVVFWYDLHMTDDYDDHLIVSTNPSSEAMRGRHWQQAAEFIEETVIVANNMMLPIQVNYVVDRMMFQIIQ